MDDPLHNYYLISSSDPSRAYKLKSEDESMKVDWTTLTTQARQAIARSFRIAMQYRHNELGTEHLLLSLLDEEEEIIVQTFVALGIELEAVRQALRAKLIPNEAGRLGEVPVTSHLNKALVFASAEAQGVHQGIVGTEHLLLGVVHVSRGELIEGILTTFNITVERLQTQFF